MTGWRIGYAAGPKEIIDAINQLQQYIVFSSSSISQKAALAALRKSPSKMIRKYQAKRDTVRKYLEPVFDIFASQGAFYAYIHLPDGIDDLTFCTAASKNGVVVLPSRAFSQRTDYVRIAFGVKHSDLMLGLKRIRQTYDQLFELRTELAGYQMIADKLETGLN